MESPAMREAYGMTARQSGVLVREIPGASHEYKVLQVDDIITSIDGVQVCVYVVGGLLCLMYVVCMMRGVYWVPICI